MFNITENKKRNCDCLDYVNPCHLFVYVTNHICFSCLLPLIYYPNFNLWTIYGNPFILQVDYIRGLWRHFEQNVLRCFHTIEPYCNSSNTFPFISKNWLLIILIERLFVKTKKRSCTWPWIIIFVYSFNWQ